MFEVTQGRVVTVLAPWVLSLDCQQEVPYVSGMLPSLLTFYERHPICFTRVAATGTESSHERLTTHCYVCLEQCKFAPLATASSNSLNSLFLVWLIFEMHGSSHTLCQRENSLERAANVCLSHVI